MPGPAGIPLQGGAAAQTSALNNNSPAQIPTQDGIQDALQSTSSTSNSGGLFASILDNNPYFSAGFGLMGVGAALTILRKGAVQGAQLVRRRMLVTLEISSKDPSYLWFLQWMSNHAQKQQLSNPSTSSSSIASLIQRSTRGGIKSHQLAVETTHQPRPDGSSSTEFDLVPGPGVHYFKYQDAWFQVRRERDGKMMDLTSGTPWETITLTTLSSDRILFPKLLSEAQSLVKSSQVGKTIIYTAWGPEWRPFGQPRERRLLDSVILDSTIKERIVTDVQEFMARGQWYSQRGIPYRRGYLLHGPPGSGKSSFIQALAGSLEYNICVMNLSERGLTDDKLHHLLANIPERSIVLLEDIDAAFSGRTQSSEAGFSSNITFSGLLNALDGVASSTSQRIVFMTTNHIEKLDPALIRPGRVDLSEMIDDASPNQAMRLFVRFYGEIQEKDTTTNLSQTEKSDDFQIQDSRIQKLGQEMYNKVQNAIKDGNKISMASLQGHFIRNTDPQTALDEFDSFLQDNIIARAQQQQMEKMITPSAPSM